jgi:hypothetical protein
MAMPNFDVVQISLLLLLLHTVQLWQGRQLVRRSVLRCHPAGVPPVQAFMSFAWLLLHTCYILLCASAQCSLHHQHAT